MSLEQLNKTYAITGQLEFVQGKGGLLMARVDNGKARALVSIYAGQVLSFKPVEQAHDLLFISDKAYYQPGKAIKGGIPVCWPWFGPDPRAGGRPAHGFVRTRQWAVRATDTLTDGDISITLGMQDTAETRAIWPCGFDLCLQVSIGNRLSVELQTRNTGDQPFTLTQALHSYFNVGAIERVQVLGLETAEYLDKAGDGNRHNQSGPVQFDQEVDRIYLDVPPRLVIKDPTLGRCIVVSSSGNQTAVVWNPWNEIAANMADLDDADYQRFVCVETTNAATDCIHMAAGSEYCLGAEYAMEDL